MNSKMKILIAYDGSECADAALVDLRRAGLPRETEAIVISVAEQWMAPPRGYWDTNFTEISPSIADQVQVLAKQASDRIQSYFPDWQVCAEWAAGSPASVIIRKADEWQPNLIVVGSHSRSAMGRFFLGSVSQKIVTHANCSVRIARGRIQENLSPVRIAIGVDGSDAAAAAVSEVAARVWPTDSQAHLIAAVEILRPTALGYSIPPVVYSFYESNEEQMKWTQKMVEATAKELGASGLSVSSVVKEGDPKRVLVDEAESWGADSIFVGARGLGGIERFLLGSVSAAVAARAHCSVEVVREDQTQ